MYRINYPSLNNPRFFIFPKSNNETIDQIHECVKNKTKQKKSRFSFYLSKTLKTMQNGCKISQEQETHPNHKRKEQELITIKASLISKFTPEFSDSFSCIQRNANMS